MAGGTGWISGWETAEARVWNSESDGQHSDPYVQRQFPVDREDTDVKPRAMVNRDVRRTVTVQRFGGDIYTANPTIDRAPWGGPWSDEDTVLWLRDR